MVSLHSVFQVEPPLKSYGADLNSDLGVLSNSQFGQEDIAPAQEARKVISSSQHFAKFSLN
jgi:hypothetical protein